MNMNKEGPQFKKHYSVGPGEFPNGSNKTLQFDLPLKMYRVFCHKTKLFAIILKLKTINQLQPNGAIFVAIY